MSWKSGSELADKIWKSFLQNIYYDETVSIPTYKVSKHAVELIKAFEDHDCDTLYECTDLMHWALLNLNFRKEFLKNASDSVDELIDISERYDIDIKQLIGVYKEIKNERHLDN